MQEVAVDLVLSERVYWVCVDRFWYLGGYRGGFCEKLLKASIVSDEANASKLQDRPTAGQGQAHQQQW